MTSSFAVLPLMLLGIIPLNAAPHYKIYDHTEYASPGSIVHFGVDVNPGKVLRKPRFHFIRDGEPFPSTRSRQWIEFPDATDLHSFKLTGPSQLGVWWLLLYEGSRLSARERVEIVPTKEKANIDSWILPDDSIPRDFWQTSEKAMMLLHRPREIRMGDSLEVKVFRELISGDLVLTWGTTADVINWSDKETRLRDPGPEIPVGTGEKLSILAPTRGPGLYDLHLFRGSELLDVSTVLVK